MSNSMTWLPQEAVIGLVLAGTLLIGIQLLGGRRRTVNLPTIGPTAGFLGRNLAAAKHIFNQEGYKLLLEQYKRAPDSNYLIQTEDAQRIIVSPRFLDEVHMLPETTLSHRESIVHRHIGHYTGMAIVQQSRLHSDICRVHLRRNLPKFMPGMAAHVDEAIDQFLAKADNQTFTPVPAIAYSFFTITRIFSYVFIGEPMCRNKEWMQAVSEYPKVMMGLAAVLRPWSPWARFFLAPFLKESRDLKNYQDSLIKLFKKDFDARRAAGDSHLDALQWIIDLAAPHEADDRSIVLKLMFLTLGAIHTSAIAMDHALLDLCERPEYLEPIREEITGALASTQGVWTLETLSKLSKMDSFMQESRRWSHPAALGMHRLALKDVTLSDGTVIPKGWIMSIPAEAMSYDNKYYKNADVFDGNRFLSEAKVTETDGENGFAKILPGNLSWGHGRLTCPGRWYADAQIKLVLAKTVQNFDFRFLGGGTKRPENVHAGERITPDANAMIEFRRIA